MRAITGGRQEEGQEEVSEELTPLMRARLLKLLEFFQNDAYVMFQLAPRGARYDTIMVGELRHMLEKPKTDEDKKA
jgi:hypothetical protein